MDTKSKIEQNKTIKVSPFRKEIRNTTPHRHNSYFEIIYLSRGKGFHTIDSNRFSVCPPVVYLVRKEQVHHWELSDEPDGYVLILKKDFLERSLDNGLKDLIEKLSRYSSLQLTDNVVVEKLFALLTEEATHESNCSFQVLEGLLKSLTAKILQESKPQEYQKEVQPDLYRAFIGLLQTSVLVKNSVDFYAEQLHTTPQNLNAVCRKTGNHSASELLSNYIIDEARRLLTYTRKTVSEISFTLGFNDSSHFIKYFKRHTGNTPKTYRENG